MILAVFEIGFVLHEKGEFVEDFRPKPNLGDLLFTICDWRFETDWVGLAEFTLISAIYVCLLWQIGGIIPDFGLEVKEILVVDPARRTRQTNGGQAWFVVGGSEMVGPCSPIGVKDRLRRAGGIYIDTEGLLNDY